MAEYLLNYKNKLIFSGDYLNGHELKIVVNNNLEGNKFSISVKDIVEKPDEEQEIVKQAINENLIKSDKKKTIKKDIHIQADKNSKKLKSQKVINKKQEEKKF